MENDPSLIESAIEKLGLSDAKGVVAPGARYESPPNAPDIKARRLEPRDVEDPEGGMARA